MLVLSKMAERTPRTGLIFVLERDIENGNDSESAFIGQVRG